MLIINNSNKTANLNSLTKTLLVIAFTWLFGIQAATSEEISKQYSISQGMTKMDISEQQRKTIIDKIKLVKVPDQLNGIATAKTRVEMLKNQNSIAQDLQNNINTQNTNYTNSNQNYTADFAIYGATSFVQNDYDSDNFYQTFSVTFDADIYSNNENQFGEVYALLYISKNGGPWTHYFTTNNFIIEGDSTLDEYEIITTFLSGYSSDYYDILIDLYQVDYNGIVASYSSDDSNALYALPLESADYDEPYVEAYIEVVETSAGSIYWLLLLIICAYYLRIKTKAL